MAKNFKFYNTSTIDLNPCIIDYSKKFNSFIIGTYQLIENGTEICDEYTEEQLTFLNNRIGSINIFDVENKFITKHCCQSGGVFDLKISDYHYTNDNDNEFIIAAHSNGMFAIYKLKNGKQIEQIRQIITGTKMLTTIDDSFVDNFLTLTIGSSDGKLFCYQFSITDSIEDLVEQQSIHSIVTKDSSSIWYSKIIRFKINEFQIEKNLIFVGCEDSTWRIFACNPQNLTELFRNCDSSYGVTSIELFRMIQIDTKIVSIILLVGSYDENLRVYSIDLEFNHNSDVKILHCCLQQKIHIEGSGIWRIRVNNDNILISAMYSGAFWLKLEISNELDNFKQKIQHNHNSNILNYKLNKFLFENEDLINENHLVYGIASDSIQSTVIFASFYAKKIFLYKLCDIYL